MKTATYHYDVSQFKPDIQNFLPILNNLSEKERHSLIDYIQKIPHFGKQKLAPLDIPLFTVHYIADDFDDYLGDEFWFPNDDILYK